MVFGDLKEIRNEHARLRQNLQVRRTEASFEIIFCKKNNAKRTDDIKDNRRKQDLPPLLLGCF
jgi:hypothetical protein